MAIFLDYSVRGEREDQEIYCIGKLGSDADSSFG